MHLDSTIAAIASGQGGAARGIVRLSGPGVVECVGRLFTAKDGGALANILRPTAIAGQLRLPELFSPLPCTLYLWPTKRSYTRQPSAELHTLGSPPLLQAVLEAVCAAGARLAGPGEFTLRAFLAGRIDLTQAEAVLGVIDASNRRALEVALAQLSGGLGSPLAALRNELLDLLAHVEAGLDFVDEDLDFLDRPALTRQLAAAEKHVAAVAEQLQSRGELREVVRAVLVGLPNAGKSSLFNALAGEQRALVSPQAGTTTDYLTVDLDLDGVTCRLIDTAGADTEAGLGVPRLAQQQRQAQQRDADIEIACVDATQLESDIPTCDKSVPTGIARLVVLTKCDVAAATLARRASEEMDVAPSLAPRASVGTALAGSTLLATSALRGDGLKELKASLRAACLAVNHQESAAVAATAARCGESLRLAAAALSAARELSESASGDELLAAEIRLALEELGQVVGAVYTDDLLDRIFIRFCIGK